MLRNLLLGVVLRRYVCEGVSCDAAPAECTGDPAIDAVLNNSRIWCKIGLASADALYTWAGFCNALVSLQSLEQSTNHVYLGDEAAVGLSNIAGLLAQCMWESGGDAPFTACDENNYIGTAEAACTQREDGLLYASMNDRPHACAVNSSMVMTAETWASWTLGPLTCEPDSVREGCCWWGRGAIQTTGPNNYGLLQQNVISQIPDLAEINLCANPEAMCQNPQIVWLGAMFYWADSVQAAKAFNASLHAFVASGFLREASSIEGADFATGAGGVVNNGNWSARPHSLEKRLENFDFIISVSGRIEPEPK